MQAVPVPASKGGFAAGFYFIAPLPLWKEKESPDKEVLFSACRKQYAFGR